MHSNDERPTVEVPAVVDFDIVIDGQRQSLIIEAPCFKAAFATARRFFQALKLTTEGQR